MILFSANSTQINQLLTYSGLGQIYWNDSRSGHTWISKLDSGQARLTQSSTTWTLFEYAFASYGFQLSTSYLSSNFNSCGLRNDAACAILTYLEINQTMALLAGNQHIMKTYKWAVNTWWPQRNLERWLRSQEGITDVKCRSPKRPTQLWELKLQRQSMNPSFIVPIASFILWSLQQKSNCEGNNSFMSLI